MKRLTVLCLPVLCLLVAALLPGARASAATYANEDYRFEADPPARLTMCTTPAPGSDHGFMVLPYAKDCSELGSAERVSVFLANNTAWEVRSSKELGSHICAGARIRESRERIAGLHFLRCGPFKEGALSSTKYFALRLGAESWIDWTQISVTVYCRPVHAKECARVVHDTFRGLRFTK
jgi:hypothetical protein